MKLSQKTILITGGSSGIGFELTRQLIERGNTVIITGRDAERLARAKAELPSIYTIESDVSDPAAIDVLFAEVTKRFPSLDILINNAGIMRNLNINEFRSLDDVTREIDINLSGPIRMVQRFLPHLKSQPRSMIVNISSGLAFVPLPISPVYCATKAAIHSYTQSLRVQLSESNVTVVEVAPPGVETPLFRGEFAEEMKDMKAMSVTELARRALKGIEAGKVEIRPGLANVLKFMSRLAPQLMLSQLAKSGKK